MKVAEMENRNYLKYPFIGVGVVVWDNSRFLLVKRAKSPRKGEWSIPGGRQMLGETTRETASREIQEEAAIRINILGLVDVVDSIIKDENGLVKFHATLVDYAAQYVSGTPQAGDDAAEVGWFTLGELPSLNLWKETDRIILESEKFIKQVSQ